MKNFIPRATGGPWSGRDADAPVRFGFLLVPDFTLIGLGAAVDPLRLVNQVVGCTLYECITLTMDGEPVRSSAGVSVQPDGAVSNWMKALDALFVVGPNPLPTTDIQPVLKCLRTLAAAGVALGGIDTGSYYLAWAGLLNGYRSTIHWEDMDALLERFPQLVVSNKIYEVDRDRCSCSGGAAPLQMMSELIGRGRGGRKAMHAVAELLQFECYGEEERQKTSLQGISSAAHPKLIEAIKLMECNIEEPLRMEELAAHLAFSGRQLERLFKERRLHAVSVLPAIAAGAGASVAGALQSFYIRHRHGMRFRLPGAFLASLQRGLWHFPQRRTAARDVGWRSSGKTG